MAEEPNIAHASFQKAAAAADDFALLKKAAEGDGPAFQKLVERHGAGLFRLACGLVNNPSDAEDVVQETFLGAFRALARFEGRSSVRTWLGQILVRQAAALRRSRRTRWMASLERTELETPASTVAGPEQAGQSQDVMMMLERLSPEHREVLVLREFEQMSYDEIAATIGVPRGTVESRLHRARAQMRELLGDYLP